jgi:hypothetical protein
VNIALQFRESVTALGNSLVDELDQLISGIRAHWLIQHKNDGSHAAVTADSVVVTDDVDAGGDVTADGDGVFGGAVIAHEGSLYPETDPVDSGERMIFGLGTANALSEGLGLFWPWATGALTRAWMLLTNPGDYTGLDDLVVGHRNATNDAILRVSRDLTDDAWGLAPDDVTNAAQGVQLGFDETGKRFDEIHGENVFAETAIYERGRTVAMGEWQNIAYAAGNFTAQAGNWTVDAGDQTQLAYTIIGQTCILAFSIANTDVSAAPTDLRIALPVTPAMDTRNLCQVIDAGTQNTGFARVASGVAQLQIFKTLAGAAFTATAGDNTSVRGQITFEIQ